ncbi:MAG: OmpA family protein [Burkholderiaceae bacterium]
MTAAKETFVILADTLFRFDKAGRADILPGGQEKLKAVATRLKSYKAIDTITITGHTDRLGAEAYNDKLSQARAETVRSWFESEGIKAVALAARGAGEREPVTGSTCGAKLARPAMIDCLQPDRRVTIEVTGLTR